jgi:predicted flap endonuclease-1-like 5' DNA nuclease
VTAFVILAVLALAIGIAVAYRAGATNARRAGAHSDGPPPILVTAASRDASPDVDARGAGAGGPHADASAGTPAALPQLLAFAEDRRRLLGELADARAETARYRQIVIDIEHNAPPPLLDAPGTPDDLKLIVGIGPVIERMLYQLGIASYRQIARLSEREIDDIDARLREFPGRIRRDAWVTQARALHAGKYGDPP